MNRVVLLLLLFLILITNACTGRKNKIDHSDLIPENDLISILTDVYLADGLLTLPKISQGFQAQDSLSSYKQIIEKHGYSKETMDKTMKYYFIKKPKKLIVMYDKALGVLSEIESKLLQNSVDADLDTRNIWKGRRSFTIPDSISTEAPMVRTSLYTGGIWVFNYTVTIFPDDESLNPRLVAYTCNADSIESGKREYLNPFKYIKDGKPHDYTLIITVPKKRPTSFTGLVFVCDNNTEEIQQNSIIENLSIIFTSLAK